MLLHEKKSVIESEFLKRMNLKGFCKKKTFLRIILTIKVYIRFFFKIYYGRSNYPILIILPELELRLNTDYYWFFSMRKITFLLIIYVFVHNKLEKSVFFTIFRLEKIHIYLIRFLRGHTQSKILKNAFFQSFYILK